MFATHKATAINISGRNLTPDGHKHGAQLPLGAQVYWGLPFDCGEGFVYVSDAPIELSFAPITARYLAFLHACEADAPQAGADGIIKHFRGDPQLMQPIGVYTLNYADGQSAEIPLRSRMEINAMDTSWGQGGMLCHAHLRDRAMYTTGDDIVAGRKSPFPWGHTQCRVMVEGGEERLSQWIYAYENPRPDAEIIGLTITPQEGRVLLYAMTAVDMAEHPLRYGRRRSAVFKLNGDAKDPLSLVDIDLGHIISVIPRPKYGAWEGTFNCTPPKDAPGEYIVDFNAHEDAILYLGEKRTPIKVVDIPADLAITPAEIPVTVRVCDENGVPVPVKIHAHGLAGQYLPPRHRHRIPNPYWFEDYSVDFVHGAHWCTYTGGTAEYLLPEGEVFFEVSKGFEIKPVRCRFDVTPNTKELTITLERVLSWRKRGWVTADTHVHFLSPDSALLEGQAEDVNVVNLLASQWGELFTNIGDFTGVGETAKGDYMVRVGTENRQHIMGHISLLGYDGNMILPLTTGGPDESAIGDPMETTLTQWAAQCKAQNGLVILPHFPNPRAENAAAIVSKLVDGVEATCWEQLYSGINPYYLSDWYRYLNCGYAVAAVGGTDKMSAGTAVGAMRTYACLEGEFTFDAWKRAVTAGRTFVTSSALIDMQVESCPLGGTLKLNGAGTLTISYTVASTTVPVTKVELVSSGETVDSVSFDNLLGERRGYFTVNMQNSAWLALRVRGRMPGAPEIITAHTSAVFVYVNGRPIFCPADAATILEQIEGATAYVKTLATRAQEKQFKLAISALSGAHRALHNRMHAAGHFHAHSPEEEKHSGH